MIDDGYELQELPRHTPRGQHPRAESRRERARREKLERLLEAEEMKLKHPPAPVASFALEEGCNHISLSATGLKLLTVSRKGEVSSIWDLKQAIHGAITYKVSEDKDNTHGPCVRLAELTSLAIF